MQAPVPKVDSALVNWLGKIGKANRAALGRIYCLVNIQEHHLLLRDKNNNLGGFKVRNRAENPGDVKRVREIGVVPMGDGML